MTPDPVRGSPRTEDARARCPRSSHAEFTAGPDRTDPLPCWRDQDRTRVPELLPIRYGRMASSAFAFFRGAALPMASDLARTPRSGLTVQACGDAHLANFGVFASPERHLVFDINDFDETLPGPWEWDVKRLATSLEIAGRANDYPSKAAPGSCSRPSRVPAAMRAFADMDALAVWYAHADMADIEACHRPAAGCQTAQDAGAQRREGADEGQPGSAGSLRRRPGRGGAAERRAAAGGAPPRPAGRRRRGSRRWRTGSELILSAYRDTLEPERRVLLDRYRARGHGPQGRRGRQRGHAVVDAAAARGRRPPALPAGEGGRPVGAGGSSAPASTTTADSGSWSGSG
jgi:hypothetical protein